MVDQPIQGLWRVVEMKKFVSTVLVSAAVLIVSSVTAFGNEETLSKAGSLSGGWSEERGYYINASSNFAALSSSEPDDHKATKKYRQAGGSNVETKLIGETWWKGMRHYTRARFEYIWPLSGYLGDTDRVWGSDKTTAETDYLIADLTTAHTYWGNE